MQKNREKSKISVDFYGFLWISKAKKRCKLFGYNSFFVNFCFSPKTPFLKRVYSISWNCQFFEGAQRQKSVKIRKLIKSDEGTAFLIPRSTHSARSAYSARSAHRSHIKVAPSLMPFSKKCITYVQSGVRMRVSPQRAAMKWKYRTSQNQTMVVIEVADRMRILSSLGYFVGQ